MNLHWHNFLRPLASHDINVMQIINIKVLRGPNYWSNYRQKLMVLQLDLQGLENYPTNKIDGSADRMEKLIHLEFIFIYS